jgi:probable HAF family extracellular repeat protein
MQNRFPALIRIVVTIFGGGITANLTARTYYKVVPLNTGELRAESVNSSRQWVAWDFEEYGGPDGGIGTAFFNGLSLLHLGRFGATQSVPVTLNDAGLVVNSVGSVAAVWSQSAGVRVLPVPAGFTTTYGTDINASGDVVGSASFAGAIYPIIWQGSQVTTLPNFGGIQGMARAINNNGDTVGYSRDSAGKAHAFAYRKGQITDLGTAPGVETEAVDINDAGTIVGSVWYARGTRSSDVFRGAIFSGGQVLDVGTLGGGATLSGLTGVNNAGLIIGGSQAAHNSFFHGVIVVDGVMLDLNSLVDPKTSGLSDIIGTVTRVTEKGELLADGQYLLVPIEGESRFANFSLRARVATGDGTMIVGFIVSGATSKPTLVRAVGPSLAAFGITQPESNPRLVVYNDAGSGAQNDDWGTKTSASSIVAAGNASAAFPLPDGSKDAAIFQALTSGAYTVHITSAAPNGIALGEVYESDSTAAFRNFSGRMQVGVDEETGIAGFVISGVAPKTVLIRALGPTLGGFGVSDVLSDPQLALYAGTAVLAQNDDWAADGNAPSLVAAARRTGAYPLIAGTKDAALLVTLWPGAYTVHVKTFGTSTGVALLELFDVF